MLRMRLITLLTTVVFLGLSFGPDVFLGLSLGPDVFLGPHASLRAPAPGPETLEPPVIVRQAWSAGTYPIVSTILPRRPLSGSKDGPGLTQEQASHFAALACLRLTQAKCQCLSLGQPLAASWFTIVLPASRANDQGTGTAQSLIVLLHRALFALALAKSGLRTPQQALNVFRMAHKY